MTSQDMPLSPGNPDRFPVSPMQHYMVMETLRAPRGAGTNVEQIVLHLDKTLDMERFTRAWLRILQHHEVLRLGFVIHEKTVASQFIGNPEEINIEVNDWRRISKPESDEYVETFLRADRKLGFTLTSPPLFRMALLRTGEQDALLVWSYHHAIADKASIVVVLRDLFQVYADPCTHLTPPQCFRQYMQALYQNRKETKAFWRSHLKDFTSPLPLPFAAKKRPVKENRRQQHNMAMTTSHVTDRITGDQTRSLLAFCKQHSFDIEYLLMGIWAVLLSHYAGTPRIGFGAQRSLRQVRKKQVVDTGMYINTLPMALDLKPDALVSELANHIRNTRIKTNGFLNCSFSDISAWCGRERDKPLFEVFFSYDPVSIDTALEPFKPSIACKTVSLHERIPGALFLKILGTDTLSIELQYDRRRFDIKTVRQIVDHFKTFATALCMDKNPRLRDVAILSDKEKQQIFSRLNTLEPGIRPDSCIHHLIEIQAATNEDAIAVLAYSATGDTRQISYGRMNHTANQLAGFLFGIGAGPGTTVALVMDTVPDQGPDPVTALFGILKSGAAYVALDPSAPDHYLLHIIRDTAPLLILTTSRHKDRFTQTHIRVSCLDTEQDEPASRPAQTPSVSTTADDLACITYASGPGGKPAGVMHEHTTLVAYTRSASEIFDIRPKDRILTTSPWAGDRMPQSLFPCLFSGACLVIPPAPFGRMSLDTLLGVCHTCDVTILHLSAHDWCQLLCTPPTAPLPEQIRLVIISGGQLPLQAVEDRHLLLSPETRLIHTRGGAESMGSAAWTPLPQPPPVPAENLPALTYFPLTRLFIANHFFQPALPDTAGELYVGGAQVAKGYVNQPDLTAAHFKTIPCLDADAVFFKTRDRVKLGSEHGVVFLEPMDRRIMLNGLQVNAEEIENAALAHPLVADCMLSRTLDVKGNANVSLIFVKDKTASTPLTTKDLKQWVRGRLPAAMVPDTFEMAPSLPPDKKDVRFLALPTLSSDVPFARRPEPRAPSSRALPTGPSPPAAATGGIPVILVGNSVGSAREYTKANLGDRAFFHAPIFIHFYTMEENSRLSLDIPQLAAKCLEHIRRSHASGPYVIIGSCQNATVAHEVACQATDQGLGVALLLIIDENWRSHPLQADAKQPPLSFMQKQLKELKELGWGHLFNKLMSRIKSPFSRFILSLDPLREKLCTALNRPVPEAIQFRAMENVFYDACDAKPFQPRPYHGPVVLLYSRNWLETVNPKLNRYYKGPVRTRHVDITHGEWFKPQQINLILDEINRIPAAPDR